jgi:type 2 lantibiotic biosynthesis protein LanM
MTLRTLQDNLTTGQKMNRTSNSVFLETAISIGARLCRDAVWDGRRCNWLGDSMEFEGGWVVVHRTFGPELYNGTSGIALFLARLYSLTGEKPFRTAALGAASHAQSMAGQLDSNARMGFYSGQTGIAYSLIELADLLENDDLLQPAFALLDGLAERKQESKLLDVISGSAGAIPALLNIYRKHSRDGCLQLAVREGETLLRTAKKQAEGFSWNTIGAPDQPDLLGFSHGTAGIGWALLELHGETGEAEFKEAAQQAFRYERQYFSREHQNWPDLRNLQSTAQTPGPSYMAAWCHGAPGIGLSRLRSYQMTQDSAYRIEAEAALGTTLKSLDPGWYGGPGNFSLCHGLGGNAETLIYGAEVLRRPDLHVAAQQLGLKGIEMYEKNRLPWPCGVPGGSETPNLLLGLAGIGYFYLRLHDPATIPSVLLILPKAEALASTA